MYGTVARLQLKPGKEADLKQEMSKYPSLKIPGFVSTLVYRMDQNANECYLAVAFKDKESYVANARDPRAGRAVPAAAGAALRGPGVARRRDHLDGEGLTAAHRPGRKIRYFPC